MLLQTTFFIFIFEKRHHDVGLLGCRLRAEGEDLYLDITTNDKC